MPPEEAAESIVDIMRANGTGRGQTMILGLLRTQFLQMFIDNPNAPTDLAEGLQFANDHGWIEVDMPNDTVRLNI